MTTEPTFTSAITVESMQVLAGDASVLAAARVSTRGSKSREDWSEEAHAGLIRFLMANRHGTPFEHNVFTFYVHAPIFVFREFHRHRIGWSYNEESARYKRLDPVFYVPSEWRPGMMQVDGGRPGQYQYRDATKQEWVELCEYIETMDRVAYLAYEAMLERGVAREVARMCLPVNIYSSMYATCNARSLMAFLSLRQKRAKREPFIVEPGVRPDSPTEMEIRWEGEAFFPSKPQHEINGVADQFEAVFREAMPITHRAWVDSGYVAP